MVINSRNMYYQFSHNLRLLSLFLIVMLASLIYFRRSGSKKNGIGLHESQQLQIKVHNANGEVALKQEHYIIPHEKDKHRNKFDFTFPEKYWSIENQLRANLVPTNVHFFWCGKKWFEFKHYLSVVSVIRAMRPDRIIINYDHPPMMDSEFYNQWLNDIQSEYPYLKLQLMSSVDAKMCQADHEEKLSTILRILDEDGGGIYVGGNTLINHFTPMRRHQHFEISVQRDDIDSGYILLRTGIKEKWTSNITYSNIVKSPKSFKAHVQACSPIEILQTQHLEANCYFFNGPYKNFYPKHIWDAENEMADFLRFIYYGTSEIRRPKPTFDELVPNIGHMVWLGGGKMDYVFYLSVLSMLYIAKVDKLYIHGDLKPKGEYWIKIEKTQPKVIFVKRHAPDGIYGGKIESYYKPLMSDIIRVELMIRYGGIYTDTDAIWIKPLTREDRGYDAVATYDWVDWSYPFPEIVNFGVSYGKRDAPFWRIFRDSMRTLHNDHPGYTGVSMPYRLLERHPQLLRIDTHLAAICYKFLCHPIFDKDFHNETRNHINTNSLKNWSTDLYALHWTHPNPKEYKDEATLLKSTGLFAEVGKRVLKAAGLLNHQ